MPTSSLGMGILARRHTLWQACWHVLKHPVCWEAMHLGWKADSQTKYFCLHYFDSSSLGLLWSLIRCPAQRDIQRDSMDGRPIFSYHLAIVPRAVK